MERKLKKLLWGLIALMLITLGIIIGYWKISLNPYGKLKGLLTDRSLEQVDRLVGGRNFYWALLDGNGRVITSSKGEASAHPEFLQVELKDGRFAFLKVNFNSSRNLLWWLLIPFILNLIILMGTLIYGATIRRQLKKTKKDAELKKHLVYLGELSRGLAHELRNPLNTITMNLQMIEEDIPSEPYILKRFDRIKRELKRLEDNLTSFLRFARPPELRLKREEINELVEHITQFFLPECRSDGIELKLELGHDRK